MDIVSNFKLSNFLEIIAPCWWLLIPIGAVLFEFFTESSKFIYLVILLIAVVFLADIVLFVSLLNSAFS